MKQLITESEITKRSNDQGQTPPEVAKFMVDLLTQRIAFHKWTPEEPEALILEPTPGKGNIVKALELMEFQVEAPDDFFVFEQRWDSNHCVDAIVMNPPFSAKTTDLTNAREPLKGLQVGYWILERCMQMSSLIIAIMPTWTICDSDHRRRALEKFGLAEIHWLPRKTFNYTRVNTCIIVLDRLHQGPTKTQSLWY